MAGRIKWRRRVGPGASGANGRVGEVTRPLFTTQYAITRPAGFVLYTSLPIEIEYTQTLYDSEKAAREAAEEMLARFMGELGATFKDEE